MTKEFYLSLLTKARINAAYFGGRDLDRFSTYQFGLFDDTKIHGVPAAGVRYDELAMVRGSYSFNAFEQYRFDVFVDRGWGRLRGTSGTDWEGITGIGARLQPAGAVEHDPARRDRQELPGARATARTARSSRRSCSSSRSRASRTSDVAPGATACRSLQPGAARLQTG